MGWRLKVSGYGKIEKAEIETAPLTLFVGDNNSGKSYLMSLLWGIRNLGAEMLFGDGAVAESEAEDRLLCWIQEQVGAAREQGTHTTAMYTTYERVEFVHSDTMPTARHGRLGIPQVRMEEEWKGSRFGLNFGERISFDHVPVKMERDKGGMLACQLKA